MNVMMMVKFDDDGDNDDKGETVNPDKDWEKSLPSLRTVDVQAQTILKISS